LRRGNPFKLLELARSGRISLTVSESILDEMDDVLRRKFGWDDERVVAGRKRITDMARTVKPAVQLDVVKDDQDDNRILECAVSAGSDYTVTGDSHLLKLKRYAGIRIVNVAEFLAVFTQQTILDAAILTRTPRTSASTILGTKLRHLSSVVNRNRSALPAARAFTGPDAS